MNLSELFIRRPVMTILLNTAIVLAGVFALRSIPVSALPAFDTPVINVSANLAGASPEVMASSVALPLEKQFQSIAGITQISSTSTQGSTSVTLEFEQNRNIDSAALDVQAALLRAQRSLPDEMTQMPSYRKINPADSPILFVSLTSSSLSATEMQNYAENFIIPTLSTLPGVAQINIFGSKRFAVRVRVRPQALAAISMSLEDLSQILGAANVNTPMGTFEGSKQVLTLQSNQQLQNAQDFGNVVIAHKGAASVRLRDVADVIDSIENNKSFANLNGEPTITLAVMRQPGANTVEVVDNTKRALNQIKTQLPQSLNLIPVNDRSISVRESVRDVSYTLIGTIVLVILVIYLFLRRLVATVIPALSLPVSLLGSLALLWGLNYSIDNVSLLGLTLAVGLVVDDAIVMLENIMRHIEKGENALTAALRGSREVGFTIISISASLVAVFIPIFFMPGSLGLLFHEFAVVVGLSIVVSAFVSLTLVPMLASRWLKPITHNDAPSTQRLTVVDKIFENFFKFSLKLYEKTLDIALRWRKTVLVIAFSTVVLTVLLAKVIPKGFFPEEDLGQIMVSTESAQDTSFEQMLALQEEAARIMRADPNVDRVTSIAGTGAQNTGRMFVVLKPHAQRKPMKTVVENLRKQFDALPGIKVFMRPIQNLQLGARQSQSQYQYILQSVQPSELNTWAQRLQDQMRQDPLFRDITSDAQLKALYANITIDRERADFLGVSMQSARSALYSAFGERQISTIFTPSDSYSVLMELAPNEKDNENALSYIYARANSGLLVPLSSFTTVSRTVGASSINHIGQLQAITVSFNLAPKASLGQATEKIEAMKQKISMPQSILTRYGGDAAVFQSSQSSQLWLLLGALLVMYVLLGVLYESFIHPITILAGLPSAAVGALLTLWLFGQELTIIAIIGILLLIGIVKKNAIMMVDFALDAQRENNLSPFDAIRHACLERFRPIMMTTLAALMGALPLALGLGAGAELRQPLGLAVAGGLLFSQAVTLYITPVIYLALHRFTKNNPYLHAKSLETQN